MLTKESGRAAAAAAVATTSKVGSVHAGIACRGPPNDMLLLSEAKLCSELPAEIVLSLAENSPNPEPPVFSLKSTAIVLKADAGVV